MPTHEIARLCCLREWIEVFYRQAKGELDWHDWQVRQDRAILRHWYLIFGAYTFVLLHGLAQAPAQKKMMVQLTRLGWMAYLRCGAGGWHGL